ncbi:MAG: MBL fold metallo-hydrolase, partial [Pseudomonadota bacterium]
MKVIIIPVTPFAQNCSLIWDPNTQVGALVDPGGDVEKLYAEVDANHVKIEKIILTHGHLDHVGGTLQVA